MPILYKFITVLISHTSNLNTRYYNITYYSNSYKYKNGRLNRELFSAKT